MIVSLNKAIVHILNPGGPAPMLSERLLDIEDGVINAYVTAQIEKVYDDAAHRNGEFKQSSGFKYHINELKNNAEDFIAFSQNIAKRLFEALLSSDKIDVCDIIVCDIIVNERPAVAVLKMKNNVGFTHQVIKDENGILNNLINHYAILPNASQKTNEYAFVDLENLEIRYRCGTYRVDGEKTDLFADILLECEYEISSREAMNTVTKAAKRITAENGGDELETAAKIKECVTESIEEEKSINTNKIADSVFDGRPVMKEEFKSKMENASVPEEIEINKYVTKKATSNIKLTTDTGIELSFPPEYYRDNKYIDIINNDDGTISIQINNINEIINN